MFAKDRLKFERPPRLFLKNDPNNAKHALGKTAHYDPANNSVTVFTVGRHPKDIIRSFAHELVHHCQNERGDLAFEKMKSMNNNYAQECPHMRKMEQEAYLEGNMCFRDWEDSLDDKLKYTMSIAENIYLKENRLMNKQTKKQKELSKVISKLLEKKIRILSEQEEAPIAFDFAKAKRIQQIIVDPTRGRMKIPFNMEEINALFDIEGDEYTEETYNEIATMQREYNELLEPGQQGLEVDGVIGSETNKVMMNSDLGGVAVSYRDLAAAAKASGVDGVVSALRDLENDPVMQRLFGGSNTEKIAAAMSGGDPFEPDLDTDSMKLRGAESVDGSFGQIQGMGIDGDKLIQSINDRSEWLRGLDTDGAARYAKLIKWFETTPVGAAIKDMKAYINSDAHREAEKLAHKAFVNADGDETKIAPQGASPQREGKVTKAYLKAMIQKILQEKLGEEIDEGSCGGKREDDKKKDCSDCPGCPSCKRKDNELEESESMEMKTDKEDADGDGSTDDEVPAFLKKKTTDESKIQTPEQENNLYESRFKARNTKLFDKLLKEWTK